MVAATHFPEPSMKKTANSLQPKMEPASWRVEFKGKGWLRPVTVVSPSPRVAFQLAGAAEKALSVRGCTVAASGQWSSWTTWKTLEPLADSQALRLPGA